jgi:N,N-dimethylformamidase
MEIIAPDPPPWLVGASHLLSPDNDCRAWGHFNGKIEDPRIYGRALSPSEIEEIRTRDEDSTDVLARWDFSAQMAGDHVLDASGHELHGRTINTPMRAVTGRKWSGEDTDYRNRPSQYAAIHFHDDDLDDARWDTDFTLTIPPTWKSGVYAAELSADGFVDYVPFVVRSRAGHEANIAVLLPTLSYRAYANEHMTGNLSIEDVTRYGTSYEQAAFRYIVSNRLNSLYDEHTDGSGVCYSSRLRPMLNFRPRYNKPGLRFRHPHNLSCDLYLIDWLEHEQYRYDVITDDDLHAEGLELLRRYRTIITGTHPEYWTWQMLQSLRAYLAAGGRIMYLGGNGFYWVSSVDEDRPHIMEVRRGHAGSRRWSSAPGELHHSTTGELGGLWRHRGLPPQSTVGIGLAGLLSYFAAAEGGTNAYPYVRTEASYDTRVAFIFEGINEELIGDYGLHLGAAAGWEIDRADTSLGTPGHALVVARSTPGPIYQRVVEEMKNGGEASDEQRRKVRADVVFYEGPNGGAVFSVGSISWCGSLSHNGYDNSVSRVTSNVLNRFALDTPFPSPPES